MVTKIGNEDGPIIRLHAKFKNVRSVHVRTLAQNVPARSVSHRRSDLRSGAPSKRVELQGRRSTFTTREQRRDCGLLPANISLQTIEYIFFMTGKSNFNSKSGLPSWEEGPFLGAVLPRSLYFSGQ